jgi:hypothetical protein
MKHIRPTHWFVGAAIVVLSLAAFGVPAGTLLAIGAALVCPLIMVSCMGHMSGDRSHGAHHADDQAVRDMPGKAP